MRWSRNEAELWSYDQGFTYETGHFSQVVWANTRYVGCGFYDCTNSRWGTQFSCNYYPPGNYGGQSTYQTGSPGSCCASDLPQVTTGENAGLCTADGGGNTGGGSSPVPPPTPPTKAPTSASSGTSGGSECVTIEGVTKHSAVDGVYSSCGTGLYCKGDFVLQAPAQFGSTYWMIGIGAANNDWQTYGYCYSETGIADCSE